MHHTCHSPSLHHLLCTAQTKHFLIFWMRRTEYLKVGEARGIAQRTKWPRHLPGFKPGPFALQANALPTESQVPVRGVWRWNPTYSIDTLTAANTSPSTAHAPYTVRLIISRKSFRRKGDKRTFIESGKCPVHAKRSKTTIWISLLFSIPGAGTQRAELKVHKNFLRCNAAFAALFCAEAAVPESIVRLYAVVTVTDLVIRPLGR